MVLVLKMYQVVSLFFQISENKLKMTIEQNRFQNYATRQIRLVTGVKSKVLNFDVDTGVSWQAYIFSNETTDKSTFVQFELSGSFGTTGIIETRIGGGSVGGDVLTGTGPCKVFATGEGNNLISVWFTPEQTTNTLPPKSQFIDLPLIIFHSLGYPPFRRNLVSIRTTNIFDLRFIDDTGTLVYNEIIDPAIDRTFMNRIYHPSNTTMEIGSSVLAQKFTVTHYN